LGVPKSGQSLTWAPEEDALVRAGVSYPEFCQAFPNRRTRHSYQQRRYKLGISAGRDTSETQRLVADIFAAEREPPEQPAFMGRKEPATDDEWEELFAHIEGACEIREGLDPSQPDVTYDLGPTKPIAVAFLGDTHCGAGGVEYARLRSDLDLIAQTDGLFVVGMGDYCENALPDGKAKSSVFGQVMRPSEQLEYARRRFGVCGGKWLALIGGNHEARTARATAIDLVGGLAKHLGAPYFTERGGIIRLVLGNQPYVILVKHDYTGRSRISKSNAGRRAFEEWPHNWERADVICLAHLHEPDLHHTTRNGRDVVWMRSGTYKTKDDYAEAGGFSPTYGVPVVVLYPGTRKVIAWPGEQFRDAVAFYVNARDTWNG